MSEPVNVTELNPEQFQKFLDSFDFVFSDCDGVLWSRGPLPGSGDFMKLIKKRGKKVHFVSNNSMRTKENYEAQFESVGVSDGVIWSRGPLPRTGEFFENLKKRGKKVHYVSNNSLRTKENYEAQFKSVGIADGFENLTVPSTAIAEYLKSVNLKKKVYCVTCPQTARVIESYGFQVVEGPEVGSAFYADYIQYLVDDEEIGAVVFDSDFRINLAKMYKATAYLRRPDVLFINGASDKIIPLKPGLTAIGVQPFTDLVQEHVKRDPVQLGKPGKDFGVFAMKRAGATDPSRVLFIGDMIEQDVGLGKAVGFQTLLVLNTVNKETMLAQTTLRPDYYAPNLGSIVPQLE